MIVVVEDCTVQYSIGTLYCTVLCSTALHGPCPVLRV
jgi:hypothetical protein